MQLRRYSLFSMAKKSIDEIYSTVIEINRILSDVSKKDLCEEVCSVKQYDSFINDKIIMPSEIAFPLLEKLEILFLSKKEFVEEGIRMMDAFIEENMFNEFDQALWRYNEIESKEKEYLSSPLIIEYLLLKMAYHIVNDRDVFYSTKALLKTIYQLMDRNQTFLYNLYLAIDEFKINHDPVKAREYLDKARNYAGHPHVYTWIGVLELHKGNVIRAVKMFQKAERRYLNDGNLTGIIFATELMGLAYYRENDYESGIDVFSGALGYAKTLERDYLISNFKNQIAWGYFRLGEYDKALNTLVRDIYNNDYTVSYSVTKFLIAYHLGDNKMMNELQKEFANRNKTLHRMISSIISKDKIFDDNGEVLIEEEELLSLVDLAEITHFELKKEFEEILMAYYLGKKNQKGITSLAESLFRSNI